MQIQAAAYLTFSLIILFVITLTVLLLRYIARSKTEMVQKLQDKRNFVEKRYNQRRKTESRYYDIFDRRFKDRRVTA